MNRHAVILFAAALATAFAGGCATGEAAKSEKAQPVVPDPCVPVEREAEAKAAAEKIALGMAEALRSGDFEKFNAVQPKTGKGMPMAAFVRLRTSVMRHYGRLTATEYFGKLDQGRVNDYLWKFVFEASKDAASKDAKDAASPGRHEVICWVRVGFAGGKPMIAGFSFDLH